MRFLAVLVSLYLGSLGSCSGPSGIGTDALGGATHDTIVRSYTDAIVAGMARACAERLREAAGVGAPS
jgi:hypothetical protein